MRRKKNTKAKSRRSRSGSPRKASTRQDNATAKSDSNPPDTEAWSAGVRGKILGVALLAALTAVVYFPVVGHEFISLDDQVYFVANPHLDGALGLDDLRSAFLEPYSANWIPLTSLSIALDNALYGTNPAGIHVTNVVLHGAGAALLFLALVGMTRHWVASLFVAAVFVVHPIHVESVAWASERKDVLAGFFWMATLVAYARYIEVPNPRRYALVLIGTALALLSKPLAVTLPFALLLLDYWPLGRIGTGEGGRLSKLSGLGGAVREKLPLFGLVAVSCVVTLLAQRAAGAEHSSQVPMLLRVANASLSYLAYLQDSVWPAGLAIFYPYPGAEELKWGGIGAGVILVAASALCLRAGSRHPHLLVGWFWFLGTLVPVIGLVQVGTQARADRYMYVPLIGVMLAVTWACVRAAGDSRTQQRRLAAASAVLIVLLSVVASLQVRHWKDSQTLFAHAVAVTENNYFAHASLGTALRVTGNLEEAEGHLRDALRMKPTYDTARIELAILLASKGQLAAARAELAGVQTSRRNDAETQAALGLVADRMGEHRTAIGHYRAAQKADPRNLEVSNNLAWLLATAHDFKLREPETAVRLAERTLSQEPGNASFLDTLAAAYASASRYEDASTTQLRAIEALTDKKQEPDFLRRLEGYRASKH
ncbi:MAG: tetratricopeptide repeat protein [bacterium]|nr:tetratricopeptide repeat protein [bacterium]